MDDFGILARDFGFKPLGKSAPMTPSRAGGNDSPANSHFGIGTNKSMSGLSDHDRHGLLFDDVFGGPSRYNSPSSSGAGSSGFDYDSTFQGKYSSLPVHDKPVYDDDVFDGLAGLKSATASAGSSAKFGGHVFEPLSSTPSRGTDQSSAHFDDFLGNFGGKVPEPVRVEKDTPAFDDLLPGFGSSSGIRRSISDSCKSQKPSSSSTKQTSNVMEDPFVVLESTSTPVSSSRLYMDPLDEISKFSSSGNIKADHSSVGGNVFDDVDPLDNLGNPVPPASSEFNHRVNDGRPSAPKEQNSNFHAENFENQSQKKVPVHSFQEPNQFGMYNTSSDFHRSGGRATSPPSYASAMANEMNSHFGTSPRHEENFGTSGDIWLTVSEVPLFTQPTNAPPPSRPPPPRPARVSKSETRSSGSTNTRKKGNEFSSFSNSSQYSYSPMSGRATATSPVPSQIDELETFAMGRNQNNVHEDILSGENVKANSDATASAAAMKEAMDKAEANFKHAKEVREREHRKTSRSRESINLERDEKGMPDAQEKELRERQERLDRDRQQKEWEEEEREQSRLEKEREEKRLEKAREMEREREKARQAVERATREARERAAAEARLRAERAAAEKAQAEAREREKAAVQRALAEARERAAAEAKERAEKAAAEAREREARASSRTEANTRFRAERASAERAAEAAARVNQQNSSDDLESFFSTSSSQPSSASRPRANSSDPFFDTEAQSKRGPAVARKTSGGASSNIRKASSSTNIVDDLSSIFGAAPSSGDFREIEGETEERRRARLERHQRTQERAAKALAEKNQRDLQVQREQAERHRIAETLDVEIKRWAAGKEGNLRALLSTLQYVLWPECGWQPVALTDMITAASVKKAYRKATLCIHPDKVQQKGANLQQKYVSEKVFDLLKEAWNKFNSEELF